MPSNFNPFAGTLSPLASGHRDYMSRASQVWRSTLSRAACSSTDTQKQLRALVACYHIEKSMLDRKPEKVLPVALWIQLALLPPRNASPAACREMSEFAAWLMRALHSLKQLQLSNTTGQTTLQLVAALEMAPAHSAEGLAAMRGIQKMAGTCPSSLQAGSALSHSTLGYHPAETLSRAEAVVAGADQLADLVSFMDAELQDQPLSVRLQWAHMSAKMGHSVYTLLSGAHGCSSSQFVEK